MYSRLTHCALPLEHYIISSSSTLVAGKKLCGNGTYVLSTNDIFCGEKISTVHPMESIYTRKVD